MKMLRLEGLILRINKMIIEKKGALSDAFKTKLKIEPVNSSYLSFPCQCGKYHNFEKIEGKQLRDKIKCQCGCDLEVELK